MAWTQHRRQKLLGSGKCTSPTQFQPDGHLNFLKYRIFLGLLVIPVFRKPLTEPNSNKRGRDEPADIALGEGNASASKAAEGVPSKKGVGDMDDLDDDDDDDEDDALEKNVLEAEEFREDRLIAFLNDPEKVVQIFLSSYMREKGLIW